VEDELIVINDVIKVVGRDVLDGIITTHQDLKVQWNPVNKYIGDWENTDVLRDERVSQKRPTVNLRSKALKVK
jgi:hypothetical protein